MLPTHHLHILSVCLVRSVFCCRAQHLSPDLQCHAPQSRILLSLKEQPGPHASAAEFKWYCLLAVALQVYLQVQKERSWSNRKQICLKWGIYPVNETETSTYADIV